MRWISVVLMSFLAACTAPARIPAARGPAGDIDLMIRGVTVLDMENGALLAPGISIALSHEKYFTEWTMHDRGNGRKQESRLADPRAKFSYVWRNGHSRLLVFKRAFGYV